MYVRNDPIGGNSCAVSDMDGAGLAPLDLAVVLTVETNARPASPRTPWLF
jgi:hypothetical protein